MKIVVPISQSLCRSFLHEMLRHLVLLILVCDWVLSARRKLDIGGGVWQLFDGHCRHCFR
jgi:hypothetical protein